MRGPIKAKIKDKDRQWVRQQDRKSWLETPFLPVSAPATIQPLIKRHMWQEMLAPPRPPNTCFSLRAMCIQQKLLQPLQVPGGQRGCRPPLGERRRLLPSKSCLTSPLLMEKEAIVRGRVPLSALVVFSSAWSPHRLRDYRPHTSQTPIGAHPLISKNNFSKRARRARGWGKRRASFTQPPPANMPRDHCTAPAARQRYLHMKANGGAEIICDTFKKRWAVLDAARIRY